LYSDLIYEPSNNLLGIPHSLSLEKGLRLSSPAVFLTTAAS
jgi:hypothetical protein